MSVTCSAGHSSASTDYCDVCGAPIAAPSDPGGSSAPPTPAAATAPEICPHCGAQAAPAALFCESCGYDFTTGALPVLDLPDPLPGSGPLPGATPDPDLGSGLGGAVTPSAPASGTPAQAGPAQTGPAPTGTLPAAPALTTSRPTPVADPPIPGPDRWVAELWVDPGWYAQQPATPEDPLPSSGLPVVVALTTRTVLVGRPSRSRGITPQVDCSPDPGVSRRHCQLSTDGQRWWVEDLQSSNGTFVASAGDPLPADPIAGGEKVELADGDRVYLGGWTRLVVRKALPGEA